MSSLNKPWRKSVLVSCVGILLLSGVVRAQPPEPDYYISGPGYVVNEIVSTADGLLSGIGLWSEAFDVYQVTVYDSFNPVTGAFGGALGSGYDVAFGNQYVEIGLTPNITLTAGVPVYASVFSNTAKTFGASTVSPPGPGVSHFSINGSTWFDLHTDYGHGGLTWSDPGAAAPANFVIDPIMTAAPGVNVNAVDGTWVITNDQFNNQTNTLTLDKTANELKPFVAEIEVTGGMSPIYITEEVTNDTDEDWIGYGFQLGFWDDVNDRFVSSTFGDSLAFRQGFNSSTEFGSPTVFSEDGLYFDGALIPAGGTAHFNLMIDLPGDPVFTFALRQYAIPEPGTAMLLAIAGLMLLGFRRRR